MQFFFSLLFCRFDKLKILNDVDDDKKKKKNYGDSKQDLSGNIEPKADSSMIGKVQDPKGVEL